MQMRQIPASPALAGLVSGFTIVETERETTRTLMPSGGVMLGLRYRGSAALLENGRASVLADATVTGMRNVVRAMRTSAGGGIVVVNFREDGGAAFLGEPLHPLFNTMAELSQWIPTEAIEAARSEMAAAANDMERIAAVEKFLRRHLRSGRRDALVRAAIRAMRAARGSIAIQKLSAGLGISQDRFEKRFREAVGASPKQYSSILRLRAAVEEFRPAMSLASLAQEAGYYDQSHFIREFRAVTGQTPQQFLNEANYC